MGWGGVGWGGVGWGRVGSGRVGSGRVIGPSDYGTVGLSNRRIDLRLITVSLFAQLNLVFESIEHLRWRHVGIVKPRAPKISASKFYLTKQADESNVMFSGKGKSIFVRLIGLGKLYW